jgi:hypothetical protein
MEAEMVNFEESLTKMEATAVEVNLKETEAVVERQELHKHLVVQRGRRLKKRIGNSTVARQKLSAIRRRKM